MKISFFIFSLRGGGAERITSYMANFWSEQGHDISVITVAGSNPNDYHLSKNVTLIPLNLDSISKNTLSGLVHNISRVRILRHLIKQNKPEVLISMMPSANITAALASVNLPLKVIGAERIYPKHGQITWLWKFLRKYTYVLLDTVVVQTTAGASWIEKNTNANSVDVIPNQLVLPIPRFKPEIRAEKKPGRKVILGVGRLVPQKQFDHLIRAFALLAANHDSYDLIILGDGEEKTKLQNLAKELNLTSRIYFPGRAGNIEDWLKMGDLFVLSSAVEGFPNALLEAMACGIACISYDCLSGPSDIITNNVSGILVAPGDIQELSKSISMLISDKQLREKFATNAISSIEEYEPQRIMERWEKTIKDASRKPLQKNS